MAESTCSIEGCDRALRARGWCATHYWRWQQHRTTDLPDSTRAIVCEGCGSEVRCKGGPRRWCDDCKAQRNRDRVAAWTEANPDRAREYHRAYYEANRERLAEAGRRWAETNPEKARAIKRRHFEANRERYHEAARQWVKDNPEAARRARRQAKINRRRRKHKAEGSHTLVEFHALCESTGWRCTYCETALNVDTVTRDHVTPLVRGGSDGIENIVPACMDCNRAKGRRTPEEWLDERSA